MQNIIAIIWDFDKTLVDGYMQDPIFKEYKVKASDFWQEVNKLPEKYKVVVVLFYYENLKTIEISKLLDISEAAVRKRLERAREILKKKMEAYNG